MLMRGIAGILLLAVGTVWILQGTSVIHGSSMSGEGKWGVIGVVVVLAGLACLVWAVLHHRRGLSGSCE
jgi:hypothetical protein